MAIRLTDSPSTWPAAGAALGARYRAVRRRHGGAVRAAGGRGLRHPVHAGRQPGEMAPGPHQLVLRDVRAGARTSRATARFTRSSRCCSTRTTTRSARAGRGRSAALLSRPTVAEVFRYRAYVDEHMAALFEAAGRLSCGGTSPTSWLLGLHHEQQHQELLLTDLKHAWAANPLQPVVPRGRAARPARRRRWSGCTFPAGVAWIGHDGSGFAFDNESPRHRIFLEAFQLASRPVTNGEFLAFMADGGYERPELWLSDGWAARQAHDWDAPLYWERDGGGWSALTLGGPRPLDPRRAGLSRQLLRGRRLRAGPAPACRPRRSGRRRPRGCRWRGISWRAASATPRRRRRPTTAARCSSCTATCGSGPPAPTPATPATRRRRGAGRVQRQVHVQPVGAARRLVRHPAQPRPGDVSQFLPAGGALAVRGSSSRPRRGP